jgi:hypothetical protein
MKNVHCLIENKNTKMVTWLPADSRLKVGVSLTLKGREDEGFWTILTMSDPMELPESAKHNSEKWHDNDNHRRLGKLKLS